MLSPLRKHAPPPATGQVPASCELDLCTVAHRGSLPAALDLAATCLRLEACRRFHVLLLDGPPGGPEPEPPVHLLRCDALPRAQEHAFWLRRGDLARALVPELLLELLGGAAPGGLAYLAPELRVARRLRELETALAAGSIVLAPRRVAPARDPGVEREALARGACSGRLVGVRRSAPAEGFLRWWADRVGRTAHDEVLHDPAFAERWLTLVPSLFPGTVLLRERCYRPEPAADPGPPEREAGAGLAVELAGGAGPDGAVEDAYLAESFADGSPIHARMRDVYSRLTPERRETLGDPLATGAGSFRDWLIRPQDETGGLSPLLAAIWESRPDLRQAFPLGRSEHRRGYRLWARRHGILEYGLEPDLLPELAALRDPAFRPAGQPELGPFLSSVYRLRPDVQRSFPEPGGRDREAFLSWARTHGAGELGYDPRLVDDPAAPAFAPGGGAPPRAPLEEHLMALYRADSQVRAAFPDVCGEDRDAFLTWARTRPDPEAGIGTAAGDGAA